MNDHPILSGVWPTMVTPFTEKGGIDYPSLKRLVDWYVDAGVHGLFAVCLSSEIFNLELDERRDLARATVEAAAGRVPVVASGHVSDSVKDQITELSLIAESGVQGVVLITNRLAKADESPSTAIETAETIAQSLPTNLPLGIYECPYPYKRLISEEFLTWCRDSGRFVFLKDTCCSIDFIEKRLRILQDSNLKLFNANAATLLRSIELGASGYSSVMANYHPELYVLLWERASSNASSPKALSDFLGAMSLATAGYPLSAKMYLQKRGIIDCPFSRLVPYDSLDPSLTFALDQLYRVTERFKSSL